jgi:hypothetical protein
MMNYVVYGYVMNYVVYGCQCGFKFPAVVNPISVKKSDSRLIYKGWVMGPHRLDYVFYEGPTSSTRLAATARWTMDTGNL